eukprot:2973299-Amphidinium_carterae.1
MATPTLPKSSVSKQEFAWIDLNAVNYMTKLTSECLGPQPVEPCTVCLDDSCCVPSSTKAWNLSA